MDGNDHLGVMLLIENTSRTWAPSDVMVFKMIAEQVAIALNNAGLRRLVKNLSVTDENSGLLKRASYLDLLMGEVRRASQQATPVTVLLMRFERATVAKEQGEAAADTLMQRLGQLVAANVRQNDLAFRYAGNAIAIVLGETGENEALRVVEKMRRLIATAIGEKQIANSFNAGAAEAVVRQQFDAVDIVTEVINRAERALRESSCGGAWESNHRAPARFLPPPWHKFVGIDCSGYNQSRACHAFSECQLAPSHLLVAHARVPATLSSCAAVAEPSQSLR